MHVPVGACVTRTKLQSQVACAPEDPHAHHEEYTHLIIIPPGKACQGAQPALHVERAPQRPPPRWHRAVHQHHPRPPATTCESALFPIAVIGGFGAFVRLLAAPCVDADGCKV